MFDHRRIFRLRRTRRDDLRDELDEEIRTHLELREEEYRARGMCPEEARAEAERRFGDLEAARRALYASARRREARLEVRRWLDALVRDVRLSLRKMARAPGYAAVSVAILALGISLTTVMFALVDQVLLRPLPFPEPDRLVSLQSVGEGGEPYPQVSMANWFDWRETSTTLAATGIVREDRVTVGLGGDAFRATVAGVGGDFFQVFRPRMLTGRALSFDDGQEIRLVTVLSSTFAAARFGSAEQAMGRTVTISGRTYEVVGVVDRYEAFPERSDLWVAFFVNPGSGTLRNNVNFQAFGRLEPDADLERTRLGLDAVARGIRETDPEGAFHSHGVGVLPLREVVVADAADTLWLLMTAVLAVLVLACANLAGLGLARARSRASEVSLRRALGSGRGAIVRQLLIEHLGMAAVGGLLGLAVAWLVGGAVFDLLAAELPRAAELGLDLRVALFAGALTVGAGLLAGIGPALRTSKLTGGARGAVRGGRGLPGGMLVATEVGLALAILIGGGLLLRSLRAVTDRDLGYDPAGVAVADVDLNGEEYRSGLLAAEYWRALLGDLNGRPGVESAAVANWIPTGNGGTAFLSFPENPEPDFGGGYRVVSDRYFETLGISLRAGRTFDARDDLGTERVVVVNRALAERAWPDEDPLGRSIAAPSMEDWLYEDGPAPWLTVIGVVDDIRHGGHEADVRPELYVLYRQVPRWTRGMNVVIRSADASRAEVPALLRNLIRSPDPSLAVEVGWLEERVADRLRERVWTQRILGGFGLAALALACLGIYGLVAHGAAQRTREIAVRAALGAPRTGLLRLMLMGAGKVIAIGTAAGLVAAYGITGLLESLLVDVPATDPLTFAAAVVLLGGVGMLAALLPSLRAARLDPTTALRGD
ncbi:MAG TPA: ADOP family duplicated permease [Longimicrobiales bacterium]|nr:ADOP family duplicated permease [Longimicrobiales bacterium]